MTKRQQSDCDRTIRRETVSKRCLVDNFVEGSLRRGLDACQALAQLGVIEVAVTDVIDTDAGVKRQGDLEY